MWKKFSDHIESKVNAYLARFQLSQLKQHSDEAEDDFFARCRGAAAKCKFADICGNEYQAHQAANHWDAAQLRPWKTFGEGRRSCQSRRGNGHRQNFRDDESSCRSVSELWIVIVIIRHNSWTPQRDDARGMHSLWTSAPRTRILPSKGIHLMSLWEKEPLGYCVH